MKPSLNVKRNIAGLSVVILATLLATSGVMVSQNPTAAETNQRELLGSVPKGLPGDLLVQLRPMGSRLQTPGKEESVLTARLFIPGLEPRTIRVVHQLSGMVRIENLRERGPVSFDGDVTWGSGDRVDEALLETFVMDTVEGLIYSARSGGAVRLLGRRFGPAPGAVKDYKGPYYDIYEAVARVRSRADRQPHMKRYYFDSQTGLLISTRYTDPSFSPPMKVETRFSDWQKVESSAYPGKIERYENDGLVFSLITTAASARVRQGVASFR